MIPEDLIDGCINGIEEAQRDLYELTRVRMFGVVKRYISNHHDAEDVTIEAYVKIFKNFKNYRKEGPIEAWLRRIFVNECLMFLRKNSRMKFEEFSFVSEEIVSEIELDFDFEEVMNFIEKLPQGCRTVFNLYVFEELQHKEIAASLNISVSTSKSQYQLARQKLIAFIQKK